MIRTILSPGVELNEVDKSQYTQDVGTTPRALIMGFAAKGPAKLTTEITSMTDFRTIYGTPTNEVERYFYNATDRMIGSGATVVAAKIPYVGDDSYVGIQYKVENTTAESPDDTILYLKNGTTKTISGASITALPEGVEKVDVKRIIIGNDATVISADVFKGCENLEYVSFASSDDAINISSGAFEGCSNLHSIEITRKLANDTFGEGAFKDCENLGSVAFYETIKTIPSAAFSGCTNLSTVSFTTPSSVNEIKGEAFKNCTSLTKIKTYAKTVGASAFSGCTGLEKVEFVNKVSTTGANMFNGCENLERVIFDANTKAQIEALTGYSTNKWGLTNCWIKSTDEDIVIGHPDVRSVDDLVEDDDEIEIDVSNLNKRNALGFGSSDPKFETLADVAATLKQADSSITDLAVISPKEAHEIDADTFLALQSGDREDSESSKTHIRGCLQNDTFLIVDKTRGTYKTFTGNGSNIDCLGILPVVTTAVNAMAIADNLKDVSMNTTDPTEISTINEYEPLSAIKYLNDNLEPDDSEISSFWSIGPNTIKGANTLNSISKMASQFFPSVKYSSQVSATADDTNGTMPFDHNMFSYIGIVVFQVGVDRGSGCLVAEPIEAFAGSLLEDAKDLRTNASTFIENVVNTTSNYISIYVNENLAWNVSGMMTKNSILYSAPAPGLILGLPPNSIEKKISFDRISENMEDVFKAQSNILGSIIDVVVDAGLSTIGQCVYGTTETDGAMDVKDLPLIRGCKDSHLTGPWPGWRAIVNLMKKFCEQTRKDCTFVVDAPRFLSLKNQRKIVSAYDATSSVTDNILPKIKLISGVNSSYGWGYTTWFKIGCAADGTTFWCPPSIFGAGAYITTRTRWNTWDAPAGMTRGVVSVDDTSFEPDLNARNVIYSNSWNYALTDIQNGVTTLEGQKTFQSYNSAFDRINVRSLFLDLERRVFRIARNYIYEPNTADTRQQFVDNITPIFSSTKAAGGCYDYKIIADETLNTPEVIDNNEFRIRIGVQPTKTIEFILMEFVASRTGSNWSELVME